MVLSVSCILIADPAQDAWVTALDEEFPENCAPLAQWEYSGSHAVIDPMFTVNVTSIPDSMTCESEGMTVPIPDAQASEGFDNSYTINKLVDWLANYICPQGIHAQIYIPEGVYHFNDQIVMKSNISLKGAGSDLTELRLLIRAFPTDPADSIMTHLHCKKDAIRINGSGNQPNQLITNVGIEDIKIVTRSAHNSSRPFSLGSFQ